MRTQGKKSEDQEIGSKPRLYPARITIVYMLLACAWILFSDEALSALVVNPAVLTLVEEIKGFAFVLTTGCLLYLLVRNYTRAIDSYHSDLRLKDEEIRNIFMSSPIAFITYDEDGRLQNANPAAETLTGFSSNRLLEMRFGDLSHPDDLSENCRVRENLLSGSENSIVRDTRLVKSDGEVLRVTIHGNLMRISNYRQRQLLIQIVDKTQRLTAEQEARDLREQLAHVARLSLMSEMTTGIAHEIIQPLTAITNYSRASLRMNNKAEQNNPEISEMLEEIEQEALRAGNIIHRLRSLVGKHEIKLVRCDINTLIDNIKHLVGGDAATRNISLCFDLEERLPDIMADGVQIQQVILNLIRNALDAMEKGNYGNDGVIVRTSAPSAAEIQVSITDHGQGLSEADEHRLFEPFFSTKEKGMGMGLSISGSIVRSHGGRMWFTRNEDRGVTFHFTVPTAVGDSNE